MRSGLGDRVTGEIHGNNPGLPLQQKTLERGIYAWQSFRQFHRGTRGTLVPGSHKETPKKFCEREFPGIFTHRIQPGKVKTNSWGNPITPISEHPIYSPTISR